MSLVNSNSPKVVSHLKPNERQTWAANGEEGWVVGPSLEHYRHINVYFPQTRSQRDVDTVTFFPHDVIIPKMSTKDFLTQAASDIITLLTTPVPKNNFSLEAGDPTRNALLKIATSLNQNEKLRELPPSQRVKKNTSTSTQEPEKHSPDTSGAQRVLSQIKLMDLRGC